MAETQEEQEKRLLEELKGKNIAHYQVLLSAWIQTKMERDRTLISLSAAGIALLTTLLNTKGVSSASEMWFFIGAFLGFLVTIVSCLEIYRWNSKLIENEIRNMGETTPNLKRLDHLSNIAFILALIFTALIGIIAAFNQLTN